MDTRLQAQSYLFDFSDALGLLRTNSVLGLTEEQYEDLAHFIIEEMSLDYNTMVGNLSVWGMNREMLSTNFFSLDESKLDSIRRIMFDVSTQLWMEFKNKGMFDTNNTGNLSFPFIMTNIVGPNVMLEKDNVISSNEVNPYGNGN